MKFLSLPAARQPTPAEREEEQNIRSSRYRAEGYKIERMKKSGASAEEIEHEEKCQRAAYAHGKDLPMPTGPVKYVK